MPERIILDKIVAFDLGTGGVKASLFDENLCSIANSFIEYKTYYSDSNKHEQKPSDWWQGIIDSTQRLLEISGCQACDIKCVSLSGHSLVAIPLDNNKRELLDLVPIWSDTRATEEVEIFFGEIDADEWYMTTGNGFPAACYPIFKLMWLRKHQPDLFAGISKVVGSKDYINFKLTGEIYTDYSYASGSGAYDLTKFCLVDKYLQAAGIPSTIFPEIMPSHFLVGKITKEAAAITGLSEGTSVACGGVDNACMALGAVGVQEGGIYTSLGSSSWIPVNSSKPILDCRLKPYVFSHIEKGLYTSAFSIFSGGNSLRWVRDEIYSDHSGSSGSYQEMDELAKKSPVGAGGIIFNPSLAGGTSQDKSVNIRGAYLGLHLGTKREDLIRGAMEGITMNLRLCLDSLRKYTNVSSKMLFCGGGSKSSFWRQMFADVFDMEIIKSNIDQDAASVGAAAIAARAIHIWGNYDKIQNLHKVEGRSIPNNKNVLFYEKLLDVFKYSNNIMADLGDYMNSNMPHPE